MVNRRAEIANYKQVNPETRLQLLQAGNQRYHMVWNIVPNETIQLIAKYPNFVNFLTLRYNRTLYYATLDETANHANMCRELQISTQKHRVSLS